MEPDAMYIVKNAGTMVIGVSKDLETLTRSSEPPAKMEKA
jgi:hypothetical protein